MSILDRLSFSWPLALLGSLALLPFPATGLADSGIKGGPGFVIPQGLDPYSSAPGATYFSFADAPIPANFFGPGSEPFTGEIRLQGAPLIGDPPTAFGSTDTIIRRTADADFSNGNDIEVPIEIVALSLQSVTPITISFGINNDAQSWNVQVALSQNPQPPGTMQIVRDHCSDTGSFFGSLPVLPRFLFTREASQHPPFILDFGIDQRDPIEFSIPSGIWRSNPDRPFSLPDGITLDHDLNSSTPPLGPFPGTSPAFETNLREFRCLPGLAGCGETPWIRLLPIPLDGGATMISILLPPNTDFAGPDSDQDRLPDAFDNCPFRYNPDQSDQDGDGWGDLCDNDPAFASPCQIDANSNGLDDILEIAQQVTPDCNQNQVPDDADLIPRCIRPDDGTGTAFIPAGVYTPIDLIEVQGDLPQGTMLLLNPRIRGFQILDTSPGGVFDNGTRQTGFASMQVDVSGTGDLADFSREITFPIVFVLDLPPRIFTGQPVQHYPAEIIEIDGEITGDPDFDLLRLRAGRDEGETPASGMVTLRRLPGEQWQVDSFFDITYRIEFTGAPGGPLAGNSADETIPSRERVTDPAGPTTSKDENGDTIPDECQLTPTPSPTATSTPTTSTLTATRTATPTATGTGTTTATPTGTGTPTVSPTASETSTPSATETVTPEPSASPSISPSQSPSPTSTPLPTSTPSPTIIINPSPTASSTPSPTVVVPTQSASPSPSISPSPSPTASSTPSPSPSVTKSVTPTPTPTPTECDCPPNTIFYQPTDCQPHGLDNVLAIPSDETTNTLGEDNFFQVTEPICDVHWWGYFRDINTGQPCAWRQRQFQISFYEDINGKPGQLVRLFQVTPTSNLDCPLCANTPIVDFHTLVPCFNLSDGWISIQALASPNDPGCEFVWATAPPGDNHSRRDEGNGPIDNDFDLAFCLTTTDGPARDIVQHILNVVPLNPQFDLNGDLFIDAGDILGILIGLREERGE